MRENGSSDRKCGKDVESRFGLMALCTKGTGLIARRRDADDSFMLTEMSMTVTGKMTKPMVSAFTRIWMELATRACGKRINNTAMVSRLGPTAHHTRAPTSRAENTAMDVLPGLTAAPMKATLSTIISKVKVSITGAIKEFSVVTGKTTRWKVTEYFSGLMGVDTKATMLMIKKRATACSFGLTVASTTANGRTANSTAWERTRLQEEKQRQETGKMENVLIGIRTMEKLTNEHQQEVDLFQNFL